jgi:hypothetical protein
MYDEESSSDADNTLGAAALRVQQEGHHVHGNEVGL